MLGLGCFCVLCFILGFSVRVKLAVPLLCVCMCISPQKAVLEMIYTVSGGTLNPIHTHTHTHAHSIIRTICFLCCEKARMGTVVINCLLVNTTLYIKILANCVILCCCCIFACRKSVSQLLSDLTSGRSGRRHLNFSARQFSRSLKYSTPTLTRSLFFVRHSFFHLFLVLVLCIFWSDF